MEIFAVILLFSFATFFVFGILTLFSCLLEMIFEDFAFGDICCYVTRFCEVAMILSGIIAMISGCITAIGCILLGVGE